MPANKKTFQWLGREEYQCSNCAFVCQVGKNPFEDQTNSSFSSLDQGVFIFEESPKSTQDVCGDMYCTGNSSSKREKCESIGGFVTFPRSIYDCGKWGAWLFVHKVPSMLQEHVKT